MMQIALRLQAGDTSKLQDHDLHGTDVRELPTIGVFNVASLARKHIIDQHQHQQNRSWCELQVLDYPTSCLVHRHAKACPHCEGA